MCVELPEKEMESKSTANTQTRSVVFQTPTAAEIEEFFSAAEKIEAQRFKDEYVSTSNKHSHVHRVNSVDSDRINTHIYMCPNDFCCRYNFDIVNDVPVKGRYEWSRVKN